MTAYIIMIRDRTDDPQSLAAYTALARLAPAENLQVVAAKTSRFEVLEGARAEAVVILRFPSWDDALRWYGSEEYQAALPHRLASGSFRAVLIEGT